jgi:nucleoside-diphosphate-sugar epimerase
MNSEPTTVLVTGASGYIAGWIIKQLLDQGHVVHATVRDPQKSKSVEHLHACAKGAPGTLKLFKADLVDQGSFDAAMNGCTHVIHTASPFVLDGFRDAEAELVRPAVDGTRNVLQSVDRNPGVRRVVLTSSIAAVVGDNIDFVRSGKPALDDTDWNTTSSVRHNPYQYSKLLAEREAWKMHASQSRWQLAVINPALVYGPSLTPHSQSGSIDSLLQLVHPLRAAGLPSLTFGIVDVREVAQAHLLAAFKPDAKGRYLLVNKEMQMLEVARILRSEFGNRYTFPRMEVPKLATWLFGPLFGPVTREYISKNVGLPLKFDNRRSVELGVNYRPVEQTVIEHFRQLIADGLVKS